MTMLNQPAQPTPNNVYGLVTQGGVVVVRGSHTCGGPACTKSATVAVFGTLDEDGELLARFNVCTLHVAGAMTQLHGAWICALVYDRQVHGECCPHCGRHASRLHPDGSGHLSVCPVGLAFPEFARKQSKRREPHDVGECEVCSSYLNGRPGPTG